MGDPVTALLTAILVLIGRQRHHLEDAIAAAVSLLVLPGSLRLVQEDPKALQLLALLLGAGETLPAARQAIFNASTVLGLLGTIRPPSPPEA